MTDLSCETDKTYSWGEFYEAAKACDNYEEIKEKFAVFEALDEAKTLEEIREIIRPFSKEQINWLNSPCLDGIVFSAENPDKKLLEKEYVETCKYYLDKKLVILDISDIANVGFTKILELLIDRGADIHADNDKPLRWASEAGHINTVKLLLNRGADIHADNDKALWVASQNGHTETIKLLLDRGADIHADNDDALKEACRTGYTETVKLLLDRGADIHADDDIPLCAAVVFNHIEVVKLLLDRGANVHARNEYCLKKAYGRDYIELVKMLIERGASIDVCRDKLVKSINLLKAFGIWIEIPLFLR